MSVTHVPAEVRRLVRERAGGRCEYCLMPEEMSFALHEVDHVIAEKHGGETSQANLALCCVLWNRRKGSDLSSVDPQTGHIANLFNLREDRWQDHFVFEGAKSAPLTATGRVTIRLLTLNSDARVAERIALMSLKLIGGE